MILECSKTKEKCPFLSQLTLDPLATFLQRLSSLVKVLNYVLFELLENLFYVSMYFRVFEENSQEYRYKPLFSRIF